VYDCLYRARAFIRHGCRLIQPLKLDVSGEDAQNFILYFRELEGRIHATILRNGTEAEIARLNEERVDGLREDEIFSEASHYVELADEAYNLGISHRKKASRYYHLAMVFFQGAETLLGNKVRGLVRFPNDPYTLFAFDFLGSNS